MIVPTYCQREYEWVDSGFTKILPLMPFCLTISQPLSPSFFPTHSTCPPLTVPSGLQSPLFTFAHHSSLIWSYTFFSQHVSSSSVAPVYLHRSRPSFCCYPHPTPSINMLLLTRSTYSVPALTPHPHLFFLPITPSLPLSISHCIISCYI